MQKNILVAEDDGNIANLIREIIERKGNNALIANDGQEAYEIFKNVKIDLIITDLKMPHLDGMTLIKLIREKNKTLPIIIVTGYGSDKNRTLAQQFGVTTILQKPCSVMEISNAIDNALKAA